MTEPVNNTDEEIGVILVHGIGEQRRFDHLDGQARFLINALGHLKDVVDFTVTINPKAAAGFRAQSDTWAAGPEPSVTICVRHGLDGRQRWTKLQLHEVWWADVNESYSLAKQFRFWLWALTIWNHPGKPGSTLPTANRVAPPKVPMHRRAWDHIRLLGLSTFFSVLGMSVGLVTILVTRLFNLDKPEFLQVVTNYVSAVKLYNQRRRFGPGLVWAREEFLDAVGEPPRVSVRRRMIRAIADVACKRYARWYVLAHSLGSVVAFNGLMETAYAWPGYLDSTRWDHLVARHLAGPAIEGFQPPEGETMPPRPAWVRDNDIAYRSRIFAKFAGLLTYGSPLEKFAGLWPALVPISKEPAFGVGVTWINLMDPLDPISGRLRAYRAQPPSCCPHPQDVGYCASPWLLLAHIKYLTHRSPRPDAALATLRWLLTDDPGDFDSRRYGWRAGKWIAPGGWASFSRSLVAWLSWFLFAAALACLAGFVVPILLDGSRSGLHALSFKVQHLAGVCRPRELSCGSWCAGLAGVREWLAARWCHYWTRVCLIVAFGTGVTLVLGVSARVFGFFKYDRDDKRHRNGRIRSLAAPEVEGGDGWVLPSQEPPVE